MDEQEANLPGKPIQEVIPLVIPDAFSPSPVEKFTQATINHPEIRCIANNKAGARCGYPHQKTSQYCYWHDPAITPEQRKVNRGKRYFPQLPRNKSKIKTVKDVLNLLGKRMEFFLEKFGTMTDPDIEGTICDLAKTYVLVKKCQTDEEAKTVMEFRLNRRLA